MKSAMLPPADPLTHSARHLSDPEGWVLYLSHSQPERLVVFVHGFWGGALKTWQHFPEGGLTRDWWRASDMLFVGYRSWSENITGTAYRLCQQLPRFFPQLPEDLLKERGASPRPVSGAPYSELLLVGHSLGGVVVRRALCEAAHSWLEQRKTDPQAPIPPLLRAEIRLFSPASAGFLPSGQLGHIKAFPLLWRLCLLMLQGSSAFNELQEGSQILTNTQKRTEKFLSEQPDELRGLRARILWANPDHIVVTERYNTDYPPCSVDGANHLSVCKPDNTYQIPWQFVETGQL
jgi:pimeloyl-ACP methyl ester carboxylesterase